MTLVGLHRARQSSIVIVIRLPSVRPDSATRTALLTGCVLSGRRILFHLFGDS